METAVYRRHLRVSSVSNPRLFRQSLQGGSPHRSLRKTKLNICLRRGQPQAKPGTLGTLGTQAAAAVPRLLRATAARAPKQRPGQSGTVGQLPRESAIWREERALLTDAASWFGGLRGKGTSDPGHLENKKSWPVCFWAFFPRCMLFLLCK